MKTRFIKQLLAPVVAASLLVSVAAADDQRQDRDADYNANRYGDASDMNDASNIGDEVDQQQWYNPADWADRRGAYNYFTDEFYNERSGQVGYHDYRSRSWNYPGSSWDDNDYWQDDWNDNWGFNNWGNDTNWSSDDWWD